ncbi:ornithine carbamoyltransferase [Breznakia sp. PF5-3]|uniref:ornithine carbamoyltransferase n=1 Tax=unclassified Breznakia TaxID=2623764 RepID=UPI00240514A0|nr:MULTISPECIES: ornithine carbamoyltransferase [unclassified Breznakia]MDF9825572.1 ornithine carbamoyltransferase [Breznakia sp. PM6-1]MDF9835879.1 ornithine carbamoyltransferase [Breznakia sp. PF5-3]MDF9837624.1 ornithine carbamoyltransferase [Breznakia sp. PFB2-8]MDF9859995.1 ornithine carbamoyltransferase [Breznakia sp. PH5-24]
MKHLLKMSDLSKVELYELLDLADQLKAEVKAGDFKPYLKNKTLGLIFQKSSTRTRVSFEVGMQQLGGYPLFLNANDMQIGRGEPIKDTARVLSRYLDGIMIRTYGQNEVEDFAQYGSIPIINGLTDYAHPCQILADLMTIREYKGKLEGLKIAYIGDGNNMANSLIVGALLAGMKISVACPKGYEPAEDILAKETNNPDFELVEDPKKAAVNADVVITDVWASMGDEDESSVRAEVFGGVYQVNDKIMELANNDAMVLHCLPAHREEEISEKVFEAHADEIFDEAENRLHAQKAVLVKLLG